jgi:RHS repeat-associated protein
VTHSYDSKDRLATRTDPVGAAESFTYDLAGNLTGHTDAKGQATTFGYDALNRRIGASYADGSTRAFSYDAAGRLAQAGDSVGGDVLNSYDLLDRLTSQTTALGTVSYHYDALGRRTRMDAPGQASVFYGYDAASRLRSITQVPLDPVAIDYDAVGRRTMLTLPNGVSTEYQYDAASRLAALIYRNATSTLGDLTYQYDAAGNRTRVGGSLARTGLPDPVAAAATYDAANRQLTLGDKQMIFDANGNLTSITEPSGTTTYTWDARNRLTRITGPGLTASFAHDAVGRRVEKQINGDLVQHLHDGLDIIHDLTDQGPVSYLRTLGIDEPLVRNGAEFYLTDALGSTVALTDPAGAVQTTYTYEPFGASEVSGSDGNPYQFTGRENDGTGLYYYRARYYHPGLARFIQPDPLGLLAGLNLYAYGNNNPTGLVDPLGLLTFIIHGVSSQGTDGDWPAFIKALGDSMLGDPNTVLLKWTGNLFGHTIPSTNVPSTAMLNKILADLQAQPLAPGEQLNLVGHSGGGLIGNNVANALTAKGIKVDNLIIMGTPLPGWINVSLPPGVPVTNFVDFYDPFARPLPPAPNVTTISVYNGSGGLTPHTGYTNNPFVINTIQQLIGPGPWGP